MANTKHINCGECIYWSECEKKALREGRLLYKFNCVTECRKALKGIKNMIKPATCNNKKHHIKGERMGGGLTRFSCSICKIEWLVDSKD